MKQMTWGPDLGAWINDSALTVLSFEFRGKGQC